MVERFLRIKSAVIKALFDINLCHLWNSEYDDPIALNILKALKPVKIAVEALSRHDANLLTAEGILKFLFNTLATNNCADISAILLEEIKLQIAKRGDLVLVSLIRFLQYPNSLQLEETDEFFISSSKNDIVKRARIIMKTLFKNNNNTENICPETEINKCDNNDDELEIVNEETNSLNLKRKLEDSIRQTLKPTQIIIDDDFRTLWKEINIYEATGNLTNNLQQLTNALGTIRPTSTQNERNFLISSKFTSKRRGRLPDKSLNCLCFLKNYFSKYDKIL